MSDRKHLPYRYELRITLTIDGDGLHADGDGATATAHRVRALLERDPRVKDARVEHPRPVDPRTGSVYTVS